LYYTPFPVPAIDVSLGDAESDVGFVSQTTFNIDAGPYDATSSPSEVFATSFLIFTVWFVFFSSLVLTIWIFKLLA